MQRHPGCRSVRGGRSHAAPGGTRTLLPADDQSSISHNNKEAVMAETWSGEFYCVKCKEKRQADGEVKVNDKGTRMAKAVCPVCSTNLNRILGKA
jgi:hypothetical protein